MVFFFSAWFIVVRSGPMIRYLEFWVVAQGVYELDPTVGWHWATTLSLPQCKKSCEVRSNFFGFQRWQVGMLDINRSIAKWSPKKLKLKLVDPKSDIGEHVSTFVNLGQFSAFPVVTMARI